METKILKMLLDDIRSAWDKDHPQSAMAKFNEACELFVKDGDYKGLLVFIKQCQPMSYMLADSVVAVIDREDKAIYDDGKEPLRALFLMMKGKMDKKYYRSQNAFQQAMSHPDELEVPLTDYEWFIDSDEYQVVYDKDNQPAFGHDLLSYIAQEARQYEFLVRYYQQRENRDAECYARCMDIIHHFGDEQNELSKLIDEYSETPVSLFALKALIDRHLFAFNAYHPMEKRNKLASKSMNQLHSYIERFPDWHDIGMVTTILEKMADPEVNYYLAKDTILPYKPYSFSLESKNVSRLVLSVYRSMVETRDGNQEINSDFIEKSFEETPVFRKEYIFEDYDKYLWISSVMEIDPLPPGLYKMVIRADGRICCAEIINVSQLCLVVEPLPKNKKRIAVLDASTGCPVPFSGVHIRINDRVAKRKVLKCDEKGETIWDSSKRYNHFRPYKQGDQWSKEVYTWSTFEYEKMRSCHTGDILTDRVIYRPGQTVHIAVVCYYVNVSNLVRTLQCDNVKITIRKAYDKHVWVEKVSTDEYGVAEMDYHIPENLSPGDYVISCGENMSTTIKVEEYKRPTFEVKLDPYTKPYKLGDTIVIKGKAISLTGVPIANAKVNYVINSKESSWFLRLSYYWNTRIDILRFVSNYEAEGESCTDHEGNFQIEVPLLVDDNKELQMEDVPLGLDIVAYADVVDATGETQTGIITLPVSNREYVLYAEVEYAIEKSEGFGFTPIVRNSAGMIHECDINYRIDNGEWHKTASGKKVLLSDVEVGKHVLQLEYAGEKAEREFIFFDSSSLRTPCETDCWEYQSSKVFPEDGSPVVIQVGDSTPGTYILYDIFSGNNHIDSGAVKTETGMIRWELPYEREYGNGILINFVWVRNQEVHRSSMTIKKSVPEMKLNLNWLSWKGEYSPGNHVKWVARIDNPDGQIVPSNMIAVVYDKALDLLESHSWEDFGPDLDWNIPDTEWYSSKSYGREKYWRASMSPYNDQLADDVCTQEYHRHGGHKGSCSCVSTSGIRVSRDIKLRSNFAETAYFASSLRTNDQGEIEIEFDLPDTLTTWKLMVVAFTQDMHWCHLEKEFISRKDLMVQSNMPRFMRVGDDTCISAKVTNLSGQEMGVMVGMELLEAKSREILFSESKPLNMKAGSTNATTFQFVPDQEVDQYICRVFAQGDANWDGEEKMIPVLPQKTIVTATHVLEQNGPNQYQVQPQLLFPKGTSHHRLSLDYTNNVLWLAVKAMKGMVRYDKKNAVSLMTALYSAWLVKHIKEQFGEPKDSKRDAEIERLIEILGKLQQFDGGFCWYKGMPSSEFITTEVLMHLSRLSAIIELPKMLKDMMEDGFRYVDKKMRKIVRNLRKMEKVDGKVRFPDFAMLQHLYNCAIPGRMIGKRNNADFDYLVRLMLQDVHRQTVYEKAMSAVILEYIGKRELALDYVESLCQYTEEFENRGRSFKTSKATYSWYSYKIPTHVAAMEAIYLVRPDKKQILVEMQKWLLNEKRTQTWETPIDSVNAVHALLFGNVDILHVEMMTNIVVDDECLACEVNGKERNVHADIDPNAQLITFSKETKSMAWGAIYASFLQSLSDVAANGSGMSIRREIITNKAELHVGDRITVRLIYTCDRNYDMVEIVDNKAACMEPVNQLSWYDSFKNVAPHDTKIVYSYYGLAEGTYCMETEFWLDRPGTYEIGLATIQCAYAPGFHATCPSQKLVVLP